MCLNASIVNPQKLGGSGVHVAVIMLVFGAFAVKKPVDRVVGRRALHEAAHHLKQRFTQMRRPFLGDWLAALKLPRLIVGRGGQPPF